MTSMFTKFWNGLLGLEAPPSPPDLHIIIEPSRRDLWRFRLVNQETGKTVMVSAGRGKKTFEEAFEAAQAVADANIIGDWTFWQANVLFRQTENQHENQPKSVNIDNFGNFGGLGPPITAPDPPVTEDEPFITTPDPVIIETTPVEAITTVGIGTSYPTSAIHSVNFAKERIVDGYRTKFPKEEPYHYKQEYPFTNNGETKMKI